MDSPAARLQRVLIGIAIPVAFLSALALTEGRIELIGCEGNACQSANEVALALPAILLLCLIGLGILRMSANREYGDGPLDRWFSRESESVMRERLEEERFEASDEGLGSRWAELEKKNLEEQYGEEE
ncbi:MAG: hypothetical protein VYB30_00860 [Candidatus Thermoplasmatota archaeon]|nr:hypothetical protein [Candidatus Thermoplasmatota archaeon]